jgi:hypothetical protein
VNMAGRVDFSCVHVQVMFESLWGSLSNTESLVIQNCGLLTRELETRDLLRLGS